MPVRRRECLNCSPDPREHERQDDAKLRREKANMVSAAVDEYIERHERPNQRTWHDTRRRLQRDLVRLYGDRAIKEVSRADINRMLDDVRDRDVSIGANRLLAHSKRFFAWCVERSLIEVSPAESVRRPVKEISRDRVLSDDELVAIWQAADSLGFPYSPTIRLLLLLGQRRDEVGRMRWQHLDLEAASDVQGRRVLAKVYQRYNYDKEKCQALDAWSRHVEGLIVALSAFRRPRNRPHSSIASAEKSHASRRYRYPSAHPVSPDMHPAASLTVHRRRPARSPFPRPRPQWGLRCIAILLCMGLFLRCLARPLPASLHGADDCLAALTDIAPLDHDLLLAFATVSLERVELGGEGAQEFDGEIAMKSYIFEHFAQPRAPISSIATWLVATI